MLISELIPFLNVILLWHAQATANWIDANVVNDKYAYRTNTLRQKINSSEIAFASHISMKIRTNTSLMPNYYRTQNGIKPNEWKRSRRFSVNWCLIALARCRSILTSMHPFNITRFQLFIDEVHSNDFIRFIVVVEILLSFFVVDFINRRGVSGILFHIRRKLCVLFAPLNGIWSEYTPRRRTNRHLLSFHLCNFVQWQNDEIKDEWITILREYHLVHHALVSASSVLWREHQTTISNRPRIYLWTAWMEQ